VAKTHINMAMKLHFEINLKHLFWVAYHTMIVNWHIKSYSILIPKMNIVNPNQHQIYFSIVNWHIKSYSILIPNMNIVNPNQHQIYFSFSIPL